MDEYDIEKAFQAIENELMASMIRNMKRHRLEEIGEGKEWSMWQAEQLKALEIYKKNNQKVFSSRFSEINESIGALLQQARQEGNMQQEIKILNAIKNGWKPQKALKNSTKTMAAFFRLNDRKLEALIKATTDDMNKAETAILRMANDQYRQVIFNAHVYANTGAGTYEKAVDMATKDFLSRGLNCVEYANGARHTLSDYAFMAIQTAAKRAYLTGEGEKRKEWGISTVIMNKRGNACPLCLPYVGKVMVDDVWSGGKPDGEHMLMSTAISNGLYHPRCKDSHTTYFPGISSEGASYSRDDLHQIEEAYRKDQKQQYAKRQVDKFSRLKEGSIDEGNREKYELKEREWKARLKEYESSNKDVIKNTVIERSVINSSEYTRKMGTLGESSEITRKMIRESRRMLYHRSGTVFEDLAFINSNTGETLRSIVFEKDREARPTKRMYKMINRTEKGKIIAIHNHPGSTPPSLNDLVVAQQRGYKYGIVVCHDGTVFRYKINSEINHILYSSAIAKVERMNYTKDSIKEFCKSLNDAGVDMEVY